MAHEARERARKRRGLALRRCPQALFRALAMGDKAGTGDDPLGENVGGYKNVITWGGPGGGVFAFSFLWQGTKVGLGVPLILKPMIPVEYVNRKHGKGLR